MRKTRFQIEQFEYVKATETTALLRIAGRWRGAAPERCALVAIGTDAATRFDALPQTPSGTSDDLWRAAYSAPLEVVETRGAAFELDTGHARIRLPHPAERGAAGAGPAPERSAAGNESKPGLLARRRDARLKAMAARKREGERALARERQARQAAERDAERERARYETAAAEARDSIARASVERGRFLHWIEGSAAERARLENEVSDLRREAGEARAAAAEAAQRESHARAEFETVRAQTEAELDRIRSERSVELERTQSEAAAREAEAAAREAEARNAEHEARVAFAKARASAESANTLADERLKALRKADRRLVHMREHLEHELRRRARIEGELRSASEREASLTRDLGEARADASSLRERVAELETVVAMLRTGFEQGERKLAVAEREAEALKARLAQVAFQQTSGSPDAAVVTALREELERRAGRLEHLERQAAALRSAIHARMAPATHPEAQREMAAAT